VWDKSIDWSAVVQYGPHQSCEKGKESLPAAFSG